MNTEKYQNQTNTSQINLTQTSLCQTSLFQAARDSLLAFATLVYPNYQMSWHMIEIAKALKKVCLGVITRLMIEAPPRHSKSLHVSHLFPAWFFGHHPKAEIMHCTYAQNFANKWGRKVRNLMSEPIYKKIFPNSCLSMDSKAKNEFALMKGGEYHALGIDGQATGKGADLAIVDDPYKNRKQAESEVYRQNVRDFFSSALYTRLSPTGRMVVMMTRWHEDDLTNTLLTNSEYSGDNWERLTFPAVNDDEVKALWPERFDLEKLMNIKKVLGLYDWNALYLQRPSAKEGNIFKREWWQYYMVLPNRLDVIIQSWDLAFKDKQESDYVVGQIWGRKGPNLYLINQFRGKADIIKSCEQVLRMTTVYPNARIKLIEDKANGPASLTLLRKKISGLKEVSPQGSKIERAEAVKYLPEGGNIYIPHPSIASWINDFIDEFANFPNGKNDDQVDAATQAWQYLGLNNPIEQLQALLA